MYVHLHIGGTTPQRNRPFASKFQKSLEKSYVFVFQKMLVNIWPQFLPNAFFVMPSLFSLLLLLLLYPLVFFLSSSYFIYYCFVSSFVSYSSNFFIFFFFFRQVSSDLCCLVAWILLCFQLQLPTQSSIVIRVMLVDLRRYWVLPSARKPLQMKVWRLYLAFAFVVERQKIPPDFLSHLLR